jgi:hypothetical protein
LLTLIPFFLGKQRDKLIALIITGPFLYVVLSLYTIDLIGILSAFPRLLFISVVYGILLYLFGKNTNLHK